MKTRTNRRTPLAQLTTLTLTIALALSLGACMSDDSPMGPEAETSPTAEAAPEADYYDVQIDLSHFKVVSDCDKDPIIGDPNPGEFDYTIEIWARNDEGVYRRVQEIKGSFTKRGGQTFSIDRIESFRVKNGLNYYVGVKATETDGILGDDYVGYAQDVNKAGGQLTYDHKLTIGSGGCKLYFYYDAEEIPIY
jgi:hypothetical protein